MEVGRSRGLMTCSTDEDYDFIHGHNEVRKLKIFMVRILVSEQSQAIISPMYDYVN